MFHFAVISSIFTSVHWINRKTIIRPATSAIHLKLFYVFCFKFAITTSHIAFHNEHMVQFLEKNLTALSEFVSQQIKSKGLAGEQTWWYWFIWRDLRLNFEQYGLLLGAEDFLNRWDFRLHQQLLIRVLVPLHKLHIWEDYENRGRGRMWMDNGKHQSTGSKLDLIPSLRIVCLMLDQGPRNIWEPHRSAKCMLTSSFVILIYCVCSSHQF